MNRRLVAMARHTARGLFALGLLAMAACVSAPGKPPSALQEPPPVAKPAQTPATKPPEAPARAAPARPAHLWPFTKIDGVEWVKLDDVAAHYRLKSAWSKPGVEMTLADARGVRFRFEANQRDFYLDGVRVFLGRPVLLHRAGLLITRLDVIKNLSPLLRPEEHLAPS